jgi:(S)-sulfolactate dehydrogenase
MILITEFMDGAGVERLAAAQQTTYAPDLTDRQGDIPRLMPGKLALIVRNRTQVMRALLAAATTSGY